MVIRTMQMGDCNPVVDIHLRSFKGFFLTFLGPSFLNLLYQATLTDASGIVLVADNERRIMGFVSGTTQPAGFYTRLLKHHLFGFLGCSLQGFLKKPGILPRLLRAFSMPGQPLPAENCTTLMSIAVDPECQGQGIGKLLVNNFLEEAKVRGAQHVNLFTDALDNDAVNQFYQSLGFKEVRTYTTPEKRAMKEYLIKLV